MKGIGFLAGQTFLTKVLFLFRTIVLARLLSPQDFGIISLSIVLIQGLGAITAIGIDKILIQRPSLDSEIIGNAWTISLIRGIVLTFITFGLCPIYSSITHEPDSIAVLRIIAFIPLLEGFINPGAFIAEREIRFSRVSSYETISSILEVFIVILLAWIIMDVRALAWGMVAGYILKVVLSFIFFQVPATPKFNKSCQLELISVAKHFIIISVGSLIMIQGDKLFIGSMLGSQKLGYYVIAYQLAVFPVGILRKITNRVAFPLFSNLQDEKKRLKEMVSASLQIQLALVIPFIILVAFYGDNIIYMLYGDKWALSAPIFKALMIVTFGRGITFIAVPYIIGTGNFSFASKIKLIETLIFLLGIYIGIQEFGLIGAAYGAGLGYMVAGFGRLSFLIYKNKMPIPRVFKFLFYPSLAVLPGVFLSERFAMLIEWSRNAESAIILSTALICYVVLSFVFQKELVGILRKSLSAGFSLASKRN
jgi:O-antigen/teichoic acid export membrane protein